MTKRSAQNDLGSALIEALIGAAVVTLTLGAMFQSIIDSASHNRMAEEKRIASLIAQSELASVGSVVPIEPGVSTGIEAGYRWQIQIEPFSQAFPVSTAGQLWNVTVSVRNARGKPLASLHTLAIAKG